MMHALFVALLCVGLAACSTGGNKDDTAPPPPPTETEEPPAPPEQPVPADRPTMTPDQCETQGGTVVGDIGDGAVHRPDYVCVNGKAPIGTVTSGIEGAVCCPPADPM